jgi:dTDP-4-dehydrorhamnose reductase
MRVVILGATGMLGQAVSRESLAADLEVLEVSRTVGILWDYWQDDFLNLASEVGLKRDDVLINCIGWIPQKSSGSKEQDEHDSHALNVELIREIQESQSVFGFDWIQIVTDCVFSGKTGLYSEQSSLDPVDLYGQTKSLGESHMPGAMRIRSSIIGPDQIHHSGLYEWFKNQPANSSVQGFTNHLWNGVSTKAFGLLVAGLSGQRKVRPGIHHWIPSDSISKHGLLEIFKDELDREDVFIEKHDTVNSANRVLTTVNPEVNLELWATAGYDRIPSIEELAREFILEDLKEGN